MAKEFEKTTRGLFYEAMKEREDAEANLKRAKQKVADRGEMIIAINDDDASIPEGDKKPAAVNATTGEVAVHATITTTNHEIKTSSPKVWT